MVQPIKFCINTDDETYGSPKFYSRIIENMGMRDDNNDDIVLNLCSISHKSLKKGKRCTIYIEGDEFHTKGHNYEYYDNSDLVYIGQREYLPFYPPKTKLIQCGVDIDYHYPRDVKKEYDYVFVGREGGDLVYGHRQTVLEEIKKSNFKVLVTGGDPALYCETMSSGRIILNVLPIIGNDACVNMRIFEGMAIGTLMTDDCGSFKDYGFIKNVHYLPLERFGEDFTDEELKRIHETGRNYVCNNFSYQGAIKQIIKDVREFLK